MTQHSFHKHKRSLIYFPIIHSSEDLGFLKETVREATLKRGGLQSLKRKAMFIDRLWTEIEQIIENMNLDFKNTVIFQDGLPICGNEDKIVEDLAGGGSRNHKLLLKLRQKGAMLAGTESPELLLEEYEAIKKHLKRDNAIEDVFQKDCNFAANLLERRDRFIAKRINSLLKKVNKGLLFMGIFHNVEMYLPEDIETAYPFFRPILKSPTK